MIAFKKRRRKHSKRKRGYRDDFTVVRITEILTDGKKPTIAAKPRAVPKPKAEAKAERRRPKAEGEGKISGRRRQQNRRARKSNKK